MGTLPYISTSRYFFEFKYFNWDKLAAQGEA